VDVLQKIIEVKKARVTEAKLIAPPAEIRLRALALRSKASPHKFAEALSDEARVNVIAEIKRASPSKGVIRDDVDPAQLARSYEASGASAISVLTEADHFRGSLDDLRAVGAAVSLPLLRKDFIFDDYQIYESALAGADAILLIVAALDDGELQRLRIIAEGELGMDALIEVHTRDELSRALDCGARLIGINNRDLRTFVVSLDTSAQLAKHAPSGVTLVSESGIESADNIRSLRALGYKAFLIGELLMRANEPEKLLRDLIDNAG